MKKLVMGTILALMAGNAAMAGVPTTDFPNHTCKIDVKGFFDWPAFYINANGKVSWEAKIGIPYVGDVGPQYIWVNPDKTCGAYYSGKEKGGFYNFNKGSARYTGHLDKGRNLKNEFFKPAQLPKSDH